MNSEVVRHLGRLVIVAAVLGLVITLAGCPGPGPDDPNGNTNTNDNTNGNGNTNNNGGPADSDGDGVADDIDQCPDTPSTATVDEVGCPVGDPGTLDADEDGVADDVDQCPNTPVGADVDANGCAESQRDDDNDGVMNDADTCPDTPAGAEVNDDGCAASQRDTDGDGVYDDVDECPNTPSSVTIDEVGCPVSAPGAPDEDEDGVGDDIDQCLDTPAGAEVDANGCAESELDDDEDGVMNDADTCPDTPEGAEVDENGCADSQRDTDGDGVYDDVDQCPNTETGTAVDATGCPSSGPPPNGNGDQAVCGDGVVEGDEECDPPDGDTCDANCQLTTGGVLANDNCDNPTAVGEVIAKAYTNVGATTDGPEACSLGGSAQVDSDLWYCYTPTCAETVVVSLCGSEYDTKLAVYRGCECPTADDIWVACNDDNCGAGYESKVSFTAEAGESYMVRVGGLRHPDTNEQGTGVLTIYCESDPDHGLAACRAGSGDCFAANGTAGCEDEDACTRTCAADSFCCDVEWDERCAVKADGIVNGFETCGVEGHDCFNADIIVCTTDADCPEDFACETSGWCTPAVGDPEEDIACTTNVDCPLGQTCERLCEPRAGCEYQDCCQAICEADPYCCLTEWDFACVNAVESTCELYEACVGARGNCNGAHDTPGCNAWECCNAVCAIDEECCETEWDEICVGHAAELDVCE